MASLTLLEARGPGVHTRRCDSAAIVLPGDLQIRALTPSSERYQTGDAVLVELPVDACRLVRP